MSSFDLACTDEGAGRPVVLLHAFPLSRRMWDRQVRAWSQKYRVIAPDFRGFGDSPATQKEFSMASCAHDLRDLLESLGVQKDILLLGLSMGGYVCFEFVRKYQDMLRGLILVATQPAGDSDASRKSRYETAEFVRREGSSALAERLIPKLLGKTTLAKQPEVVASVRSLIQPNSREAIAQACHGLASRRDSTSLLPEVSIPTLIVTGSEDALIPAAQGETMQSQITHSQLVVVEQSGHLVNLEQPEVFDSMVTNFLQRP